MHIKEIGISTRIWVDSIQGKDYWRVLCEFGIEPPGFIRYGVNSCC